MGLRSLFRKTKQDAAVFIDFEHWAYSLSNKYGLKPEVDRFYQIVADKYDVRRINFFGKFSEPVLKSSLDDIRRVTNNIIETSTAYLKKDFTDFIMLDYIYRDIDEYPDTDVYILFTGDGHFSSVANYLKEKKKKRVIVYAVAESVSRNLQDIADECYLLPIDSRELRLHYRMVLDNLYIIMGGKKKSYPTLSKTIQTVAKRNKVDPDYIADAVDGLMNMGIISQEYVMMGAKKRVKVIKVDWKKATEKGFGNYNETKKRKQSAKKTKPDAKRSGV